MAENECQCSHEGELAALSVQSRTNEKNISTLFDKHDQLIEKLDLLIPAVAKLEVKAGLWGGVSGLVAALATIGIAIAVRLIGG